MIKEINFKGLSLTPDDHHTQPGELSLCTNVELHNGALRPSVINGTTITHKEGDTDVVSLLKIGNDVAKLLYIHKSSNFTHYIATVNNNLYWFKEDGTSDTSNRLIHTFSSNIYSVTSIGNTLIVMAENGLHYVLRKDGQYKYLGQKPPFVELQFQFYNRFKTENTNINGSENDWYDLDAQQSLRCEVKENKKTELTELIFSMLNRMHHETVENNRFYAPFYVRYAYKLYDGSLYMHSAPIFMPISLPVHDIVHPTVFVVQGRLSRSQSPSPPSNGIEVSTFDATLRYRIVDNSIMESLREWSDIVSSIEIFLSPQIVRTKQGALVEHVNGNDEKYYSKLMHDYFSGSEQSNVFSENSLLMFILESRSWMELPLKEEDKYIEELKSPVFYKIRSFGLNESFPDEMSDFPFNRNLSELVTYDQMTDDYKTHSILLPANEKSCAYIFNGRLNLCNTKEHLFNGFRFVNAANTCDNNAYAVAHGARLICVSDIILNVDGEKKVVRRYEDNQSYTVLSFLSHTHLFYPDSRATKMIIYCLAPDSNNSYTIGKKIVLDMESAPNLNGAFTKMSYTESTVEITSYIDPSDSSHVITVWEGMDDINDSVANTNKIYTSEIRNPYFFPLEGIVTVGEGAIVGLAGITRSLSPSQMGVFVVMAYCSDGIWALGVNAEGLFSTVTRLSFDVCVNYDTICQLGQSVLFATDRGILQARESDVNSISDSLDGPEFDTSLLPDLNLIIARYAPLNFGQTFTLGTPPIQFLKSARLLYDFANDRIIAFPASSQGDTAMVFSIKDSSWSVMEISPVLSCINGYPYPYIQRTNGRVICLDKNYDYTSSTAVKSLAITRSLSFSSVMQVLQGFQQIHDSGNPVLMIIYGSNDNRNWKYIGKSERSHAPYIPGHPFRYFRIALFMRMNQKENYSKLLLDVIEKYQKL